MGTIPKEILYLTKEYIRKIKEQIPVEKVFLFGSYANDNFNENSDVDLAVFSPVFENMSRVDGLTFLLMQALEYRIDIQAQPYSMKDYSESTGLVDEIIKTGIEIPVC